LETGKIIAVNNSEPFFIIINVHGSVADPDPDLGGQNDPQKYKEFIN
jgi:hypothetical protein